MNTLFSALITLFLYVNQQTVVFPIDEYGKYTFSEVVELQDLQKEKLYENGRAFIKEIKVLHSRKKNLIENEQSLSIKNKGSFYVYRLGSVKKAIDGAVEYDITLEFKDGRYRYTITNFQFNEYQRNRYGKFEPVKGKYMPLEMQVSSLNKKTWDNYREVVYEKTQELIVNMAAELYHQEPQKKKKAKSDEDW